MQSSFAEMSVFARAVETGSFSAAARALNLTPSAVSKQIARLEDRLGARLLNRTTRRLSLTETGQDYYRRASQILLDVSEAEHAVLSGHETPRGILRVSASIAFGQMQIAPLVPAFLGRYPEVTIDLNLSDRLIDLVEEGTDVAIRVAALTDSSLVSHKIADDRRVVCASPSYLTRYGTPQEPEDLAAHNCLIYSTVASEEWRFVGHGGPRGVRVKSNFRANGGEAIRALALAGIGIARLAAFVVGPDIRAGRLVPLLSRFSEPEESSIHAVYPHRRHLSPKVRGFVDFLVEKMSPPPWIF